LEAFQKLKLKKTTKYIIFAINKEKTEIVTLKESTSKDYDEFLADLPENDCRWAVYDLEFTTEEGGIRNKLVFYHWYVVFNQNSFFRCRSRAHFVFVFVLPPTFLFVLFFHVRVCDNDASRLPFAG
jgi:hypothetical protein